MNKLSNQLAYQDMTTNLLLGTKDVHVRNSHLMMVYGSRVTPPSVVRLMSSSSTCWDLIVNTCTRTVACRFNPYGLSQQPWHLLTSTIYSFYGVKINKILQG